jgi:hypothetical protein
MAKLKSLKQKIDWHAENGGFSNDLKVVRDFKYSELLPESYRRFYEIIGVGSIGSHPIPGEGYLIHEITLPEFYHSHDDWDLKFDGEGPFFDSANKHLLKNVLLLGYDVDRDWIGFDISTQSTEIITCSNNQWQRCTTDLTSYIEDVITRAEQYCFSRGNRPNCRGDAS